jgi:NADH:ubiquinone oxidoreductase subunit F (NADH-binding)
MAFIYIRGEFGWIADILEKAIDEAKADGKLNGCDMIVHRGAGSYVCGEETALIESLEGKRGQPRPKPPFPTEKGLYGCPTIVNNVETLASIPFIIEHGADGFKKWGFPDNYGFKLFAVSGHVKRPGVYEYPIGVSFMELLSAAGGVKGRLKAAIVGGLSAPILTAAEWSDLNMDYASCEKHGTNLGARGVIVISEDVSIPELALRSAEFYARESCGKCTPCREGTYIVAAILKRIFDGFGNQKDIKNALSLIGHIEDLALCPVGGAFSGAVRTMVKKFRSEFDALVT